MFLALGLDEVDHMLEILNIKFSSSDRPEESVHIIPRTDTLALLEAGQYRFVVLAFDDCAALPCENTMSEPLRASCKGSGKKAGTERCHLDSQLE